MLIRSQNKRCIVNLDNIDKLETEVIRQRGVIMECYPTRIICCNGVMEVRKLGEYSTEEKAIKVLDMIQDAYGHCVVGNVFMNGRIDRVNELEAKASEHIVTRHIEMQTFQMPQDDEV